MAMGVKIWIWCLKAMIALALFPSHDNSRSCNVAGNSEAPQRSIELALHGGTRLWLRGGRPSHDESGNSDTGRRLKKTRTKSKGKSVKTLTRVKHSAAPSSNTEETSISKTQEMRLQRLQKVSDQAVPSSMSPLTSEMHSKIDVLRSAMLAKDKKIVSKIMSEIGELARKHYAKKIWDVKQLTTDGFAIGDSRKLRKLQHSLTAVSKNTIHYNGTGSVIRQIREQAEALCLPNPTDQVLGIDEFTEIRYALEQANETSEDVAVKWWLEKKREKKMQEKAKQAAIREELMTEYATAYYVMCKQLADAKGKPFDPIKAEEMAITHARQKYEIQPLKQRKREIHEAATSKICTPMLVKPKGRKRVRYAKRRGPRRKLYKKPKKRVVG
ncbi:hypothetical protein GUITHDRAFT_148454 [Guillardia theta CCMP2712]|uniref:Uncharacterized protein n=2 Tax=Guillardia theta TaxID=55529 RepID=L1I9U1_GUITC|nr:hypothetical protein GUITHDRAFT_148454 [Guillardia theta CCMP2712]EKX32669.1 hypothetical protein GUITHDRAFT_148454 [Guillardia theta CCMP2712]|eukprot:XP_005819649.1 hypothetical protein GUITHDRAFT_148454 [Guillardia theta CCMP2712]